MSTKRLPSSTVMVNISAPARIYLSELKERDAGQGLFTESMMAAIAQSAPEAKKRVPAFLEGKAAKVKKS